MHHITYSHAHFQSETTSPITRKRKASCFGRRNSYYIRIGKNIVLPITVLLHDPDTFTDIMLQVYVCVVVLCVRTLFVVCTWSANMTALTINISYQELLSILREILPLHFGLFEEHRNPYNPNTGTLSTKYINSATPEFYRGKLT